METVTAPSASPPSKFVSTRTGSLLIFLLTLPKSRYQQDRIWKGCRDPPTQTRGRSAQAGILATLDPDATQAKDMFRAASEEVGEDIHGVGQVDNRVAVRIQQRDARF
jgi:hypothetical protein